MKPHVRECLEVMKTQFAAEHGRPMTPTDCVFDAWWRSGDVAMDEPPGLTERDYQLWLYLGGKVEQPTPVTMDDL